MSQHLLGDSFEKWREKQEKKKANGASTEERLEDLMSYMNGHLTNINKLQDNFHKFPTYVEALHNIYSAFVQKMEQREASLLKGMNSLYELLKSSSLKENLMEIKYIGNRLNEIEKSIDKILKEGIPKNVKLSIECEGFPHRKSVDFEEDTVTPKVSKSAETQHILSCLNEIEQKVLTLRYAKNVGKMMSLAKIGKQLGLSPERIRQIEHKAFRKIRKNCHLGVEGFREDHFHWPRLKREVFG